MGSNELDPIRQGASSPWGRPDSSSLEDLEKTLRREIHLAKHIQMRLLNGRKPNLREGALTGRSIPARLIGGDYYDFYPLPGGSIRIVIGDVMGKGIPAAMLMILTRGAFRSASATAKSPGETLTAMNQALYEDLRALSSFVTVFCADWNPVTNLFTYANAGHTQPLLVKGSRGVSEIPRNNGVMLGGLPGQTYGENQIRLEADDTVFFYTDGIIEAENKRGEQFSRQRLIELLHKHGDQNVNQLEQTVVDAIQDFTEDLPQKDDITMVIIKAGKNGNLPPSGESARKW
ncbi:serine/threonine-protein phosphatase [Brevibacillus sp. SYP-B805]|uniref:PP2C family protein-serine/threonine phosphatase n=1 Tax=Brevibacillus sp. SYP-B805 TaxID=1578199 RepID=UPI0013EA2DC8|nr:PP2C family protein-serine/threonine phosphatase [Brevibacillus sp. SYP-B805]NGQ94903.1 serine/threonine-protein phosphatase [Brevibacillus sp. SYP-B805]